VKLITELIFGRKYSFDSKMSAADFIAALKNRTTGSTYLKDDSPSKPFVGKIKGNKIRLRRHLRIRKAFTPILSGKLMETNNGCRLQGRISIDPFILVLLAVWFGLFFSIAVLFIIFSGMDEAVDWLMTFPLFFIFLLLLVVVLMAKSEIDRLQEDLELLLIMDN
jgi:hypothetical protein